MGKNYMINSGKKAFILSLILLLLSPLHEAYSMEEDASTSSHHAIVVKPLKEELLENGVIVRVWSGALHGGESVGHVSLETAKDYISFWPSSTENLSGHFMQNLQDDLNAENSRDPENTIFLKHSNTAALEGVHNDFKFLKWLLGKRKLRWALHGEVQSLKHSFTEDSYNRGLKLLSSPYTSEEDKRFLSIYETWSFNCASLVLNLLKNNEYLKTIDTRPSILSSHHAFNTAVTPDRVAAICSEKFLQTLYAEVDAYSIYQILSNRMKNKGVDKFLSHHVQYFGRYYLKSEGDKVSQNMRLEDDIADIIRGEKEEHVAVSLIRMMDSMGLSDMLAHALGPNQVASILGSSKK